MFILPKNAILDVRQVCNFQCFIYLDKLYFEYGLFIDDNQQWTVFSPFCQDCSKPKIKQTCISALNHANFRHINNSNNYNNSIKVCTGGSLIITKSKRGLMNIALLHNCDPDPSIPFLQYSSSFYLYLNLGFDLVCCSSRSHRSAVGYSIKLCWLTYFPLYSGFRHRHE